MPKTTFQIHEDDTCAHLLGYHFPSFFHLCTTMQNKYKINAHMALVGTINLTLTSFYVLILLIK